MIQFHALEDLIITWGKERKIIPNAKTYSQVMKAASEMGELMDAELKNNIDEIKDAVGDIVVCLLMYCSLRNIDLTECLNGAYQEIKDRKGTLLPNGTFVKE